VSLVCIGSLPGRPGFKGLGELAPDELASLFDTRQRVDERQFVLADRAWQAFRAPTPEPLDAVRRDDLSALPYLARALGRFLEEYPWTRDGLSRTERRLLQVASGGTIALSDVFARMHDGEDAYYVTDASLAAIAESLSRGASPLLTLDRTDTEGEHRLDCRVAVTDAGRSVLAGHLDRVRTCGIDRWLGGVHLQGGERLWRWDDARQRVMAM
jgi:hypothetical protein